jgi:hypothetical protein
MVKDRIKRLTVSIKNEDGSLTKFVKELVTIQQEDNAVKIAFSILQGGCFDEKSNILYPAHRIHQIEMNG